MSLKLITWHALRWCGSSFALVLSWAVWLVLGVLLLLQIWVATHRELPLPDFALRALERRLAASDASARFGRAIFDPTGRVVLENVELRVTDYATPLLTIRTAYARVDFWALLVGSLRLQEIRLSGVALHLPAMLSPSGADEALVSDLDGVFRIGRSDYAIDLCTFRLAGVEVSAHGGFHLPRTIRPRTGSLPVLDLVLQRYLQAGRKLVALRPYLEALAEPQLQLELTPSETRGALVDASLLVQDYRQPPALTLGGLRARTSFPLLGEAPAGVEVRVEADSVAWNGQGTTDHVRLDFSGMLAPDRFAFTPQWARMTAARGEARGIPVASPFADLTLDQLPRVQGLLAANVEGAPQVLRADLDVKRGAGSVAFTGSVTPLLLRQAAAIPGFTAARWVTLQDPLEGSVTADIAPGWKPAHAEADVAVGRVEAHDVQLDGAAAHLAYSDHELRVTDLVLRLGDDEARGSYTMDVPTRTYRFLLQGRLRPPDISPWYKGWWPKFWEHFDFAPAPPVADVDIKGRWGAPQQSAVFVHVDADHPTIRGVAFDHVRTTLFVRPYYYDIWEFKVDQGAHSARGKFLLTVEPHQARYRTLDFEAVSDLDPVQYARLYGPVGLAYLAPYTFVDPPHAQADGHLSGPDEPGGKQTRINLVLASTGRFTARGVPFEGVKLVANLNNDRLDLRGVEAGIGGGTLAGEAHLSGPAAARRLAVDARLQGANLGRFVAAMENYEPLRKAVAVDRAKSRFLENAAACDLNLSLKAEGRFQDLLSYQGKGSVRVHGHGLVEFPLLKLLFELLSKSLLNFKSQRLDTAQSDFTVEGPRLVFPELRITGPSAAIEGGGVYQLDTKTLDFTARIAPFREHHFVLTDVLGVALTPLLSTLEVRLTGQLASPSWSLTFLRSITPPARPAQQAAGTAPAPPTAEFQLVPDDAPAGTTPAVPAAPAEAPATPGAKPPAGASPPAPRP